MSLTLAEAVTRFQSRGIRLTTDGASLWAEPAELVAGKPLEWLKANKPAVIRLLLAERAEPWSQADAEGLVRVMHERTTPYLAPIPLQSRDEVAFNSATNAVDDAFACRDMAALRMALAAYERLTAETVLRVNAGGGDNPEANVNTHYQDQTDTQTLAAYGANRDSREPCGDTEEHPLGRLYRTGPMDAFEPTPIQEQGR